MTTRRNVLKTLGLGSLALMNPRNSFAAKDKRPNIIFILADDMGWSDPGCYGGEINTPNLDRMAYNGVRFTRFYNTAKCFPSRACLLTGLYAQQCGMNKRPGHFENCVTLGNVLKAAGYRTLMSGKHHSLDNPVDQGFDRYYGLRDGCCNYFNPGNQREGEPKPARKRDNRAWCIDDKTYQPYTPEAEDFYTTDYFTKYALQYLEEYKDEDKPFFLYLSYTAPHDPLMAWPEDIAKYEGKYLEGYKHFRQARYQRQKRMGLIDDTYPLSEKTYQSWESLSEEERKTEARKMAVYAAMIDSMDQNIGKILQKVRELGEEENTLVLFASDNGCSAEVVRGGDNVPGEGAIGSMSRWSSLGPDWANVSNTPYRFFKNYSHEGGICTPLIAYWPAEIKEGGRVTEFTGHFIDVMPTLMEVAGANYPETYNGEKIPPYEGISFLPVLQGKELEREKPIFFQWARGKAVIWNQWKLVSWGGDWELYNVEEDKTETNNLTEQHPEVVRKLESMHQEWLKHCEAS